MSEAEDLSSDNERNPPRYPSSRPTLSASRYSITASSPNVIIISDDEDEMPQNPVINRVVKKEQKLKEIPCRAIKREILFFFLGHSTLDILSNYDRFTLNLTRDSISVWFLSRSHKFEG